MERIRFEGWRDHAWADGTHQPGWTAWLQPVVLSVLSSVDDVASPVSTLGTEGN